MLRSTLHTMRLVGHAPLARLAERLDLPPDRVRAVLRVAESNGWAAFRGGHFAGWSLTAAGRRHGEELLAAEVDILGVRRDVESVYEAFLPINQEFLVICTDWQVRRASSGEQQVNDHSDPDWDRDVVERLRRSHADITRLARRLAERLERFAPYEPRFTHALLRIEEGDPDWLTKPLLDSYHSVWFELHEDLLGTLGRQRSQER